MAGRLPVTRRIRVVTARRGEFGDLDGERESFETKNGERERDFAGKARVPCAKSNKCKNKLNKVFFYNTLMVQTFNYRVKCILFE